MRDQELYVTTCCDLKFIGMNHSPEGANEMCRACGGHFDYISLAEYEAKMNGLAGFTERKGEGE